MNIFLGQYVFYADIDFHISDDSNLHEDMMETLKSRMTSLVFVCMSQDGIRGSPTILHMIILILTYSFIFLIWKQFDYGLFFYFANKFIFGYEYGESSEYITYGRNQKKI